MSQLSPPNMLTELSSHILANRNDKKSDDPAITEKAAAKAARRDKIRRKTVRKVKRAKQKINKALTWREQHLYFYYFNYTDFIVMRWLRNPLMYALWVTFCSTYTVSQCLEAIITKPDSVRQKIEITHWGFYALTIRFVITAINSWRYVRKFGITTLPITEEEEVVVFETIVDDDDPPGGTSGTTIFQADIDVERTNDYIRVRDGEGGVDEEKDREDLHKLLTRLYSAVRLKNSLAPGHMSFEVEKATPPNLMSPINESADFESDANENRKQVCQLRCKTALRRRSIKCASKLGKWHRRNVNVISNSSLLVSKKTETKPTVENRKRQLGDAETNFYLESEPALSSNMPHNTTENRLQKLHGASGQKPTNDLFEDSKNDPFRQHRGQKQIRVSLQNKNLNNQIKVEGSPRKSTVSRATVSSALSEIAKSARTSMVPRREAVFVKKETQIVQVDGNTYLSEVKTDEEKKRCCWRLRKSVPFQKKVSVPVIGACHYSDGTAGHFVVKSLKRKKRLEKLSMLLATQWVLQNISNNMAFVVSSIYWLQRYLGWVDIKAERSLWRAINDAVINLLFATVDMNLSSAPVRMIHFWMPMVFMLAYCGFTWVYWYFGGRNDEGKTYVYEFLDWGEKPLRAVFFLFLVVFVIIPAAQCVLYLMFRFREYIFFQIHKAKKRVVKHIKKRMNKGQRNSSFTDSGSTLGISSTMTTSSIYSH